jgi:GrpB-like predicted nucleotidyltransferase (UPF0157 family)
MTVIEPYDPAWPDEFATLAARLRAALGDLALRVDHIGSTSVPGLAAKDIIDIQVTVRALAPRLVELLEAEGFVHVREHVQDHVPAGEDPDPALWSKLFFRNAAGQRACNVHLRADGHPNQRYAILFRDYLRSHPGVAGSVELVKRELARRFPTDEDAYYAIKDPVYDLVWQAARRWAGPGR